MHSSIVIKASQDKVWGVLTNYNTWEAWFGGKLNSVTPGWVNGASMEWEHGFQSRISGIEPFEFIEMTSNSGMKTKIVLSGKKRGQTEVVWDEDFSSSYISISDPDKKIAQINKTLVDLKDYVEKAGQSPRTSTKAATTQNSNVNAETAKTTNTDRTAKYAAEGKGKTKNTFLSTILSFIIPGLGQIYNGQIFKGVIIFFAFLITFITCICPIIIWIYGMYDAFNTSVKINNGELIKDRRSKK